MVPSRCLKSFHALFTPAVELSRTCLTHLEDAFFQRQRICIHDAISFHGQL